LQPVRVCEGLVELAGEVALQAADDLFLGQAFGGAALHYLKTSTLYNKTTTWPHHTKPLAA